MSIEIDEKPSFYAVLPAYVRYEKRLKPMERLLFAEISALANKHGYCTATNGYFSRVLEVHKTTVVGWLNHLEELGFIQKEVIYDDKQIIGRKIFISDAIPRVGNPPKNSGENNEGGSEKTTTPSSEKTTTPSSEKTTHNNTRFNNTRFNNPLPPKAADAERFVGCADGVGMQNPEDQTAEFGTAATAVQTEAGNATATAEGLALQTQRRDLNAVPVAELLQAYNGELGDVLPPAAILTGRRRSRFIRLWNQYRNTTAPNGKTRFTDRESGIRWFRAVFAKTKLNPFWLGQSSSGWTADLDWLLKDENFLRVIEWRPNGMSMNTGGRQ